MLPSGRQKPTFQLTTSQGGRPSSFSQWHTLLLFQLTTSQGGRRVLTPFNPLNGTFQLTTSQGGRPGSATNVAPLDIYFNSRPRKEVDEQTQRLLDQARSISTHDLARRSTLRIAIYDSIN